MKKTIYTLLFTFFALSAFAQEQAIYSQYQLFPVLINAGHTGFDNQHQFLGNVRSSWAGFPGAPQSYTFLYTGPVGERLALGGGMFSETIGSQRLFRLQANYAFRFQLQKMRVGIGLTTEFLRRSIDSDLLDDPIINPSDPILEDLADGQQLFDASLGIHALYDERFFISLALPNTVRARLDQVPLADQGPGGRLFEHYVFQLGYIVDVPSQGIKIVPSIALRNLRNVPYQVDINLQGRFLDEKLITGLIYRPGSANGSSAFLIGSKFNQIQACYSYELNFGNFQQYSGGAHEITVALAFDRKEKVVLPE